MRPARTAASGGGFVAPPHLKLREDATRGIYVENLTEEGLESADDALRTLTSGAAQRQVGCTAMNKESSRSHAVFTLTIQAVRSAADG